MTNLLSLLGIAIGPVIFIAIVVYGYDKYDKEPKKVLLIAFLLGCISVIPAVILEGAWMSLGFLAQGSLLDILFFATIVVGLSEALSKFLMLRIHAYRHDAFNEAFDGIVYGVFVSLGFAAVENFLYVYQHGIGVGIVRMFTAVPFHACLGVIIGYYVGKAKFKHRYKTYTMIKGIVIAILFHGAYDFMLMQHHYPSLMFFALIVLYVAYRFSKSSIKEMQKESKLQFWKRSDEIV